MILFILTILKAAKICLSTADLIKPYKPREVYNNNFKRDDLCLLLFITSSTLIALGNTHRISDILF